MLGCIQHFRENNNDAIVIPKILKFPDDDRTYTNFIAQHRIHFWRSNSTLDSLKSVFNEFRRKPSLGVPVRSLGNTEVSLLKNVRHNSNLKYSSH